MGGELAEYNFTINYRPGKSNGDADGLSRMALEIDKLIRECTQQLDRNVLHAIAQAIQIRARGITYLPEMAKENASADIDAIIHRGDRRRMKARKS